MCWPLIFVQYLFQPTFDICRIFVSFLSTSLEPIYHMCRTFMKYLVWWSTFCICLREACYLHLNFSYLHLYDPKWVSERLSIFRLDFPSCEEETGSEKWHKPLKGISLRPAELICWRCKKLDYLAVLNVYFVARRQPSVFVFEPNHLRKNYLTYANNVTLHTWKQCVVIFWSKTTW